MYVKCAKNIKREKSLFSIYEIFNLYAKRTIISFLWNHKFDHDNMEALFPLKCVGAAFQLFDKIACFSRVDDQGI